MSEQSRRRDEAFRWSAVFAPARERFPHMSRSEQRRLGTLMRREAFLAGLGSEAQPWDLAEAKALNWILNLVESSSHQEAPTEESAHE